MSARARWLLLFPLAVALVTGCDHHTARRSCTDDAQCDGERCYVDGRCLPEDVVVRLGGSVGDQCRDGATCGASQACRMGRCEDDGSHDSQYDCTDGEETPYFAGLLEASPDGPNAVALRWAVASDDTLRADLEYLVFVSPVTGGFDLARPAAVLRAELTYRVTGLTAGRTYYFLVRVRDGDGNVDCNLVERWAPALELGACVDYATVIQPMFSARCVVCHSGPFPSAGLHLDTHAGVTAGGRTGAALTACHPEDSLLYDKLASDTPAIGNRMPLIGTYLSEGQLALVWDWIEQGAHESCPNSGCP